MDGVLINPDPGDEFDIKKLSLIFSPVPLCAIFGVIPESGPIKGSRVLPLGVLEGLPSQP